MADGRIIIGEYESYPFTKNGKLVVGEYEPYPFIQHGKLSIGYLGETSLWGSLSQSGIGIISGRDYKLSFIMTDFVTIGFPGTIDVKQGTQILDSFTTDESGTKTITFTADSSGDSIGFYPNILVTTGKIDTVKLKELLTPAASDNRPAKEFLVGNTDDGGAIFFRADTQVLQIQPSPQMYSNPIAIASELEAGTQTKIFVSLDDKQFFQLEGTVTKGVSILKPATSSNINSLDQNKPPLVKTIQLSYRDSSKNLCRLIQAAVITIPTPIDYAQ